VHLFVQEVIDLLGQAGSCNSVAAVQALTKFGPDPFVTAVPAVNAPVVWFIV
jgi:hypothetical protein